jgi:hypothetical protein
MVEGGRLVPERNAQMKAASDYFNALPFEQRKALAPLLENYRQMGIDEAIRDLEPVMRKLRDRSRSLAAYDVNKFAAPSDGQPLPSAPASAPLGQREGER